MERAICSDKALSAQDGAMGNAYRAALAQLPPDGVSKLRVDQVRWLDWLQTGCGVPGLADPAATEEAHDGREAEPKPATLAACMLEPYRSRTAVLRHAVARVEGVLFLTRSMYLLQPNSKDDTTERTQFRGFGELEASWPEALAAGPKWAAWNAAVLQTTQRSNAGPDDPPATAWDPAMADGEDTTVTMSGPKLSAGRVQTDLTLASMGHGAAHPNEGFQKYIWLLHEGRWLRASDVFQPGSRWQEVLAEQCWRQLKQGENSANLYDTVKGPEDATVQRVISDVKNWTITPAGLSISWPEYAVTPRAFPQDDTVVPWKVLQEFSKPGFVP